MSFDALGKTSVGAAAGVVAERGGYVDHALSQLSDTIGVTCGARSARRSATRGPGRPVRL